MEKETAKTMETEVKIGNLLAIIFWLAIAFFSIGAVIDGIR